jgi:hypothetical protein
LEDFAQGFKTVLFGIAGDILHMIHEINASLNKILVSDIIRVDKDVFKLTLRPLMRTVWPCTLHFP